MTRFESPALYQPELHLPAGAVRVFLAAVALAATAAAWLLIGSMAGQFGTRDTRLHVTLPPVVVSGQRILPEDAPVACAAADCAAISTTPMAEGSKAVTLAQ